MNRQQGNPVKSQFKSIFAEIPWTWLRRLTQLVLLLLFLYLFRMTESNGTDHLNAAANIIFRIDPLTSVCTILASRQLIPLLWPAVITAALTLLLGRFFCGWICPLGTLLDVAGHLIPRRLLHDCKVPSDGRQCQPAALTLSKARYFLLTMIMLSALLGVQLIGFLSPFSILLRAMTVALDPFLTWIVSAPFTWLVRYAPDSVTGISEPIFAWLKGHILAFAQGTFLWSGISLSILIAVFALELVDRRFWCRYLCPSGALFGILARFSLLKRIPGRVCRSCQAETSCAEKCRMGAFNENEDLLPESCNMCMDCVSGCPLKRAGFRFKLSGQSAAAPYAQSRRLFLASAAAGAAIPLVARSVSAELPPALIRPPGVRLEPEFLDLCLRCGECLKVCTTNALQPVLFEAGLTGLFTPRLIPRMGYCEYNCRLCGQVCPSGAIPLLPLTEKHKFVMGLAVFNKKLCLPYAKGESCITCEEHCPLPQKAIEFKEVETKDTSGNKVKVKQPFTVFSRCIGCGICVTKCPIEGDAGVEVLRKDAVPIAVKEEYKKLEPSL